MLFIIQIFYSTYYQSIINYVMRNKHKIIIFLSLPVLLFLISSCGTPGEYTYPPFTPPEGNIVTVFSAASDMREYTGSNSNYFRGVCKRIQEGGRGDFMVSAGDIDPPGDTYETIQNYIGRDYIWYPVVGNHEKETPSDMSWLRSYNPGGNTLPEVVNTGPSGCTETMYSFEYGNAHFSVINEYYDGSSDTGTEGDVNSYVYSWLENDLQTNTKPVVIVIGHEPAYPLPDEESGRLRHENDSLNQYPANRDSFWNLLKTYNVKAYICGHTHNYSISKIDSVWQVDTGHSRGTADRGAKSTFIMFYITDENKVWYQTYRISADTAKYEFYKEGLLD